jgi:histidyl-tRNA synthetase
MTSKPSVPKGTRDFSPDEMIRRKYILSAIEQVFLRYGYQPLETPAMENLSTLLGKYGEEGDKLLFKILNSGNFLEGLSSQEMHPENSQKLSLKICDRGLRYDLTVPFARFVVQHRNELLFPFKRYQIQPVWRADKPQKGRYREFYQCDVDVIGSDSFLNEAELVLIADDIFSLLGIPVTIKLNNRKILAGIAEIVGAADRIDDITIAIDKLDKIGQTKVTEELHARGIEKQVIQRMDPFFHLQGTNTGKLTELRNLLKSSPTGMKGLEEMEEIIHYVQPLGLRAALVFDLTLARGLDYYTGTIIEVIARDIQIGSLCGGGRYDDLTGIFGLPGVSGVGISFGADRIYDVMLQSDLFPRKSMHQTRILFVNFGPREASYCLGILKQLRDQGITAEMYPDCDKMKKQLGYADAKKIPFVAIIGENEMEAGIITLKNMQTGTQEQINLPGLIQLLK